MSEIFSNASEEELLLFKISMVTLAYDWRSYFRFLQNSRLVGLLGFWSLTPLSAILQLYHGDQV
jgi:hypothetical protein